MMENREKLIELVDSHLYNIKGIGESVAQVQKVCDLFKSELSEDSTKEIDGLCKDFAEIVTAFLKEHTQSDFSNEMKDNCFDALNCIRYKMLAVAKPVMFQRFLHINTALFSAEFRRKKPSYKRFRADLFRATEPFNQRRKIG